MFQIIQENPNKEYLSEEFFQPSSEQELSSYCTVNTLYAQHENPDILHHEFIW